MELSEVNSALKELENSGDEVYKIAGQLMIKSDKDQMKKELQEKKENLDKRMKTMENQERTISERIDKLRNESQSQESSDSSEKD